MKYYIGESASYLIRCPAVQLPTGTYAHLSVSGRILYIYGHHTVLFAKRVSPLYVGLGIASLESRQTLTLTISTAFPQ